MLLGNLNCLADPAGLQYGVATVLKHRAGMEAMFAEREIWRTCDTASGDSTAMQNSENRFRKVVHTSQSFPQTIKEY
jgi:hypothetical protein